jgi:hypothetical protein
MDAYVTISFANLDLALRLVKREHVREGPNFTNHAGTQGLNDVGRSHAQRVSSQIINTTPKSQTLLFS